MIKLFYFVIAFSVSCGGTILTPPPDDTSPDSTQPKDDTPSDDTSFCVDHIIYCHFPPGNLENPQTVEISCDDIVNHVKHGDYPGECD